ncbi:MAG: D-alanine--D-alanine ligase [Clostridiales bacterium]|nr:D-alanine--D-alanine ligase [Clostridiales bacterium]
MKIIVLAGGLSPERDVSLSSGSGITNALLSLGHRAVLVDLFYGMPELPSDVDTVFLQATPVEPYRVSQAAPDREAIIASRTEGESDHIGPNVSALCKAADIVFLALHGAEGEDGRVQAWLDGLDVRYTGSDARGCALAMHKEAAKAAFREHGILTPPGILLEKGQPCPTPRLPCVVKPLSGGSSLGISIVREQAELADALAAAFALEDSVLVEDYIEGRELSCGVLGERALPLIEIIPNEGFYDYHNKYQPGAALEVSPAELDERTTATMQAAALAAFHALRLKVYARIDFILARDGSFYCLEANTLPGMTATSLLPQEAQAAGLSYAALCAQILALSLEK